MAFWLCKSFENASQQTNKGYYSFLNLGFICIGWSNRMAEMQVMNYPFIDEEDIQERLSPILRQEAMQEGKHIDDGLIRNSDEFNCYKTFFLTMRQGDTVLIRNIYNDSQYVIGNIVSDIQWCSGYELDLLQRDPSAIFAIRRVNWVYQGDFNSFLKDTNLSFMDTHLSLSNIGDKKHHGIYEILSRSSAFEWHPERTLYVIPPEKYVMYCAALNDEPQDQYGYQQPTGGDFYGAIPGGALLLGGHMHMMRPAGSIMTSYENAIIPISAPITVFRAPPSPPPPPPVVLPIQQPSPSPTLKSSPNPVLSPSPSASPSLSNSYSVKAVSVPSPSSSPSPSPSPSTVSNSYSTSSSSTSAPTKSSGIQIRINLKKTVETEKKELAEGQSISNGTHSSSLSQDTDNNGSSSHRKHKKKSKKHKSHKRTRISLDSKDNLLAVLKSEKRKDIDSIYDVSTPLKVLVHIDTWPEKKNLWVDINLVRLRPEPPDPSHKQTFYVGEVVEIKNAVVGGDDTGGWYAAVVKTKKDNQLRVQYVGFDVDTEWVSVDPKGYPKCVRKFSNAVTGGCMLDKDDKVELMWRDKEREKQFCEPFGWYEATVLEVKDLSNEKTRYDKSRSSSLDDNMKCGACREKPISTLLVDCMHLCICSSCSSNIKSCPICNSPVGSIKILDFR